MLIEDLFRNQLFKIAKKIKNIKFTVDISKNEQDPKFIEKLKDDLKLISIIVHSGSPNVILIDKKNYYYSVLTSIKQIINSYANIDEIIDEFTKQYQKN